MPGIRGSILSILSRMLACQEFQWNSCLSFLTLTLCKKIGFWPSCWPIFLGVAADGYVHSNFYSSLEFILWWPKSYNSISFLTWHYYFWNKIEVLQKKRKKKDWFWTFLRFSDTFNPETLACMSVKLVLSQNWVILFT